MNPTHVVVLYGFPACGKFTIGQELASLTGFPLFHNHLTVDLLLTLFPFGSPEFVAHRERIWLGVMGDAVKAGRSFIFTFSPENTLSPAFPDELCRVIVTAAGRIHFVRIHCSNEELERRVASPSRQESGKLTSLPTYRALRASGAFHYPALPIDCSVDSSATPPAELALTIARELGLIHR